MSQVGWCCAICCGAARGNPDTTAHRPGRRGRIFHLDAGDSRRGGHSRDEHNLPGIVGGFLAGLAINAAAQARPAKEKLEFFGNSFFIPIFFLVTGFLIDPLAFYQSITTNFPLAAGVIGALLLGKWIAAQIVGRQFAYRPAARNTMGSLTLPQVAATLAAALVGFTTFDPAGERLIDTELLNVVLVLVLTTAILGPVLTAYFAPRMRAEAETAGPIAPVPRRA